MRAAIGSSALARIFLVAGFGVALFATPASAQKAGGSITVGLELDIPGFDPLKVGVLRHRGADRAAAIFDTLTTLDDKGKAAAEARAVLDPFRGFQDLDLQAAARRQIPRRHAVQCRRRSRRISTGRRIPPTSAAAPSTSPTINNVQAPDELTVVYNLNDPAVNFPALVILREPEQLPFTRRRPGRPRATTTTAIPSAPVPTS